MTSCAQKLVLIRSRSEQILFKRTSTDRRFHIQNPGASAMGVNAKSVQGRRDLRFNSLDDIIADAERLTTSPNTRMLGNWPLGHLFAHLSFAINSSIDGFPTKAPWFLRLVGPLVKPRLLKKMSAGFNLPRTMQASFFPDAPSASEGLQQLQTAVGRTRTERMDATHPILGKLSHDEWTQLHLRHSEMHFSFALPE